MSLLSDIEIMIENAREDIDTVIRHCESLMNSQHMRADEHLKLEKALNKARSARESLFLYLE